MKLYTFINFTILTFMPHGLFIYLKHFTDYVNNIHLVHSSWDYSYYLKQVSILCKSKKLLSEGLVNVLKRKTHILTVNVLVSS